MTWFPIRLTRYFFPHSQATTISVSTGFFSLNAGLSNLIGTVRMHAHVNEPILHMPC